MLVAAAAAAAIAAGASIVWGWLVVAGAIADTPSDVVAVVVKMGLGDDVVVVVVEFARSESIGAPAADTAMDDEHVLAGTGTVEEDVVGRSCDKGGNSSCCK